MNVNKKGMRTTLDIDDELLQPREFKPEYPTR
jgi:hypothetical protein